MPPMVALNVHMKSTAELTIGDLAQRFGLATHVLRHWESMGLLAPVRDLTGQRRYGEADLARVAMILIGKEAGFGLRALRTLLTGDNPMAHTDLLRRHVAALEDRIAKAPRRRSSSSTPCPAPSRSTSAPTRRSASGPASHPPLSTSPSTRR